jgi:hypothetical protein
VPPASSSWRPRFVFSASRSARTSHGIADPYPPRIGANQPAAVTDRRVQPFNGSSKANPSQEVVVGIGVSLILIAVGAVLAFAVDVTTSGFNINTIGYILLVVGIVGALISLVFWSSWGGVGGARRTVVDEGPATRRRTVVEDDVV